MYDSNYYNNLFLKFRQPYSKYKTNYGCQQHGFGDGVRTIVHQNNQNKNLKKSADCKHQKQMNHDLTCLTNANKWYRELRHDHDHRIVIFFLLHAWFILQIFKTVTLHTTNSAVRHLCQLLLAKPNQNQNQLKWEWTE